MHRIGRHSFIILSLIVAPALSAQQPGRGRIVGRVLDASTGQPVPSVQVTVEGTNFSALTEWSGRYLIDQLPSGTWTVSARTIGYAPKSVTGIVVPDGGAVALDITLSTTAVTITGVEVTAEIESGSVARALQEQRTSNQIVNSVSAEQISRSPDSDAGQAVQRVSGVTVQDGRYVLVRGLGERYTTTSLNGARIPSPEPERKMVPLDLFPSGLLDGIVTAKTFTPDLPGDFSGAQVNLRTRDFLLGRVVTLSMSGGYNEAGSSQTLPFAPKTGSEWIGVAGNERTLPAEIAANPTLAGLTTTEKSALVNSFRNVWTSKLHDGLGKGSFAASMGGSDPVFGRPLDYLLSVTYSNEAEARVDERKAWLIASSTTPSGFDVQNRYRGATGRSTVLWGGILNLAIPVGSTGRLRLENTYTRSGENEAERRAGFHEDFNTYLDVTRLTFIERTVRAHQLRGEHLVGGRHGLDWLASVSTVRRYEPDRSDLAYQTTIDSVTGESHPYAWFGGAQSARRTFTDLHEKIYEGAVNYRHQLGAPGSGRGLKIGALYKATDRDAPTLSYDIQQFGLTEEERSQPAEAIFSGTYAGLGKFFMGPNAGMGSYTGVERLGAGYVQLELPLGPRWRAIGGARVEHDRIEVRSVDQGSAVTTSVLENTDVLPALALTFSPSDHHNVRFSLSQTLSRPDFREISPVTSFEPLGGQSQAGNPDLRRALIQNADLRWEWYPSPAQIVSAAVFAKRFEDPIERLLVSRASDLAGQVTWGNANRANNYGVELELRTSGAILHQSLQSLGLFLNTTLMQSEIEPGNDSLSSLTSAQRPMVGQAEYVVNAGLSYTGSAFSATLLYNLVGPRIREAAMQPLPDVIEESRHVFDVSMQAHLTRQTTLKLDAKNLLDAPYRYTQGGIDRHYYRTGRSFSLGLSWTP